MFLVGKTALFLSLSRLPHSEKDTIAPTPKRPSSGAEKWDAKSFATLGSSRVLGFLKMEDRTANAWAGIIVA